MARAKRPSDDLYNARRKAKRLAARLEKAGDLSAAKHLRDVANASYGKQAAAGIPQLQAAMSVTKNTPRPDAQIPKPITPTGQKKSRPKRPSDELYNARRRLRRQAEKLEREAKTQTVNAKKLAEGYAKFLRQQAEQEKGRKLTAQQMAQEIERLGAVRAASKDVAYGRFKIARRNAIFMQQLNAAGTEGADSSISQRKKSVFWAATKGLWPKGSNVPRNERYDLIAQHFYSDNTTDAREFREWLEREKGIKASDAFGDLQLVYEYITEELNDPEMYEQPDVPYEAAMDLVRTAM